MEKFNRILMQFILPSLIDILCFICGCHTAGDESIVITIIGIVVIIVSLYGIYKTFDSWDMYGDMK